MGSENKMNDGTSFQQSEKQIVCANGCGFFGTAAMMNLCSKCYRDRRLKEEQAASAKAAVEKTMTSTSSPNLVVEEYSGEVAAAGPSKEADSAPRQPEKPAANRCGSCNKRVGVLGFKCRCGRTFCGSHRYAEEHACDFDFKRLGKDAIAKANPIVKADKIQRF